MAFLFQGAQELIDFLDAPRPGEVAETDRLGETDPTSFEGFPDGVQSFTAGFQRPTICHVSFTPPGTTRRCLQILGEEVKTPHR